MRYMGTCLGVGTCLGHYGMCILRHFVRPCLRISHPNKCIHIVAHQIHAHSMMRLFTCSMQVHIHRIQKKIATCTVCIRPSLCTQNDLCIPVAVGALHQVIPGHMFLVVQWSPSAVQTCCQPMAACPWLPSGDPSSIQFRVISEKKICITWDKKIPSYACICMLIMVNKGQPIIFYMCTCTLVCKNPDIYTYVNSNIKTTIK